MANRFTTNFKSAFFAGSLVLVPAGLTIWVFFKLVGLLDGFIRVLPAVARPETYLGFPIPGLGILLTIAVVWFVGWAMRYYTGRRVFEFFEGLLGRVPVLSAVFHGLKQLIESIANSNGTQFRRSLLVEYPRRGLYCIAFLTNESSFLTVEGKDEPLVSVFLPTTPNPTSGFYLMVPRCDVLELDISVDQAFKLIMSAGIVVPDGQTQATPLAPQTVEKLRKHMA